MHVLVRRLAAFKVLCEQGENIERFRVNDVSNFSAGRKLVRCRPEAENLSGFLFVFFFFYLLFFFFSFCSIKGLQQLDFLKSGLVRNRSLEGTVEIRFTMPLAALMVWRKTTSFFLILGIFPMFWRVMICYSRPHGQPCLLNLSAKASGVVPVFIAIEMSGLA